MTDLVGMTINVTLPRTTQDSETTAPGVSGILEVTQLRDYWTNATGDTATVWQSVLSQLKWSEEFGKSKVLAELNAISPNGLSVRLMPLQSGDPRSGRLIGVVGTQAECEPRQFVAARRLMTQKTAGQHSFPVASSLETDRRKSSSWT